MVGELTKAMERVGLDMRVAALVSLICFLLSGFLLALLDWPQMIPQLAPHTHAMNNPNML